jgi:hypothetical protein
MPVVNDGGSSLQQPAGNVIPDPGPGVPVMCRFSDAGCPSVEMVSACRHPKTCTLADLDIGKAVDI